MTRVIRAFEDWVRDPKRRWFRRLVTLACALVIVFAAGAWAKRRAEVYVSDVLMPRVQRYAFDVLLPKAMEQAQQAVQDGIRNGVGGAASDLTGGIIGGTRPLSRTPDAGKPGIDPCRVPPTPFGLPGLPRLP